jgi:hypothetical protein
MYGSLPKPALAGHPKLILRLLPSVGPRQHEPVKIVGGGKSAVMAVIRASHAYITANPSPATTPKAHREMLLRKGTSI